MKLKKRIELGLKQLVRSNIDGIKYYLYNYWLTYFPSYHLRIYYLRHVLGLSIGKESFVHMGCYFEGNRIQIGDNTVIGRNCYLSGSGGMLTIKNSVSITAQTYIICSTHLKDSPLFESTYGNVTIEDRAWVGARAMILPDVHIGKGSILGAQSTATKDIPDFSVYAGTPARKIGRRKGNLTYVLRYFPPFQ
jgi:acetyltransferase-like isoleucine patch superfamily enzyme